MPNETEPGRRAATEPLPLRRFRSGSWSAHGGDPVAREEPLSLRVRAAGGDQQLTLTMRTPGHDRLWALGWLHAEGLLPWPLPTLLPDPENENVLTVVSADGSDLSWLLEGRREGVTSSACGVCGSGSVERLLVRAPQPIWSGAPLSPARLAGLPERLRAAQPGFAASGGLHAAGLFTPHGELLAAFEDVGRHNAVDKLVGWALERGRLPLSDHLLVTSSRAGFEIVQKAALAGIPVVITVGAPSSLAVDTAAGLGLTLAGFVRGGGFNLYCGEERVEGGSGV